MPKVSNLSSEALKEHRAKRVAYMRRYNLRPDVQLKNLERKARYRAKNKDVLAKKELVRYYTKHDEIRAKQNARAKIDPDKSRAQNRQYNQKWRDKHRAKLRIYHAKYQREHPEQAIDHKGRRRAREYGSKSERISWKAVWAKFNGTCGICQTQLIPGIHTFHYDHIVPLAAGGEHITENLQVAHAKCNHTKGARHITH